MLLAFALLCVRHYVCAHARSRTPPSARSLRVSSPTSLPLLQQQRSFSSQLERVYLPDTPFFRYVALLVIVTSLYWLVLLASTTPGNLGRVHHPEVASLRSAVARPRRNEALDPRVLREADAVVQLLEKEAAEAELGVPAGDNEELAAEARGPPAPSSAASARARPLQAPCAPSAQQRPAALSAAARSA